MQHHVSIKDDNVIVSFSGDIDLQFSGDVRNILMDALPQGRKIIVELGGVNLIDSSGIASLLEAFQNARKVGKDFIIVSINAPVLRVFNLAKLETVFVLDENVETALKP